MKKHHLLIFCLIAHVCLHAQEKVGAQLYKYFKGEGAIQPICTIQTADNWYTELRYNYEDAQTFSIYGGKKIEKSNINTSFTPMLGVSMGRFSGVTAACNTETELEKFFFLTQSQYSYATKKNSNNFFFNWSDLGYNVSDNFYAGLSMQYTHQSGTSELQPGLLLGMSLRNIEIPVYLFKPFQSNRGFVVGLVYEYSFAGRKNSELNKK